MLFFKRRHENAPLKLAQTPPIHHAEGYLAGQFLLSTPQLTESPFSQSVLFLFAHSDEGAMGVMLNQPMEEIHYGDLLDNDDTTLQVGSDQDVTVYYGGPVDRARGFVVHSDDYHTDEVIYTHGGLSVSANTHILKAIVEGNGPRKHLLAVGYAGWGPGQLEKEIEENSWITVPASPELAFMTDDEAKWGMASQSLGIDMHFFSPVAGHA